MERVIAVFDIGKTNKKLLLFNEKLDVVFQHEEKFPTTVDEDGFECDDIELIERWMKAVIDEMASDDKFILMGINFSTYGASLAYVDADNRRLTPIYNYLKPIDGKYAQALYAQYGGEAEFCRKTASPALGAMLNAGVQLAWMKGEHPDVLNNARYILHFPQYLSFFLTRKATAEYTSIGCHTYMWDFDKMGYHPWLADNGFSLPGPQPNTKIYYANIASRNIPVGIGIHDSSSSLVPYIHGCHDKFLLISTGTWCINMNPFNHQPLTADELKHDCLCYMSVNQKPVKSSRLFMGHIHDVNVKRLVDHFGAEPNAYKKVKVDEGEIRSMLSKGASAKIFFANGISGEYVDNDADLSQFSSFDVAYRRLMYDLTLECASSIDLVNTSDVKKLFVSGGFARNEIFVRLLADFFPDKQVFTSEVDNSSALGAALVILEQAMPNAHPHIDLGLTEWKGF
ncbi:MAG: FGGY family carbohydrate kinase [Breznakibacter sp.]